MPLLEQTERHRRQWFYPDSDQHHDIKYMRQFQPSEYHQCKSHSKMIQAMAARKILHRKDDQTICSVNKEKPLENGWKPNPIQDKKRGHDNRKKEQ